MMKRKDKFFDNLEDLSGLSRNHPIISLSLLKAAKTYKDND